MARGPVKLKRPELADEIALRYPRAKTGWEKSRLLRVKLASEGQHHADEIAQLWRCSLRRVFDWLKLTRDGGLESLLTREKPGPQPGEPRLLKDRLRIKEQIAQGPAEGRWKSAPQLSRWLQAEHGLEVPEHTARNWFKKSRRGVEGSTPPAPHKR